MGFLRFFDYKNYIQNANLFQIIASTDSIRLEVEAVAQSQMISYLTDKYDCDTVFAPTTVFSYDTPYGGNALAELNYPAWVSGDYAAGQYVSYTDGGCYYCILNTVSMAAPTNPTYWFFIGKQNDLYYLPYPNPLFSITGFYKVGDIVFWKNKKYTCQLGTILPDHADNLQAGTYSNIPNYNVFPDDPVNGVKYWGSGVDYSVTITAGAPLTGFVQGDNRNAELVMYMVRILVYHISSRLSPNNTPAEIEKRYMGIMEDRYKYKGKIIYPTYSALGWLQSCQTDRDGTVALPHTQPAQGSRINGGSNIKQVNGY